MKFFSKSLSQALQEEGCVSESDFYYILIHGGYNPNDGIDYIDDYWMFAYKPHGLGNVEFVRAFHPWDLCGGSENARKIVLDDGLCWHCDEAEEHSVHGDEGGCYYISKPDYFRHKLIDLPEDEQEEYVWKTMRKAA